MTFVYYTTYVMAFVFLAGETARRGLGYFAVNATTMIEDYSSGAILLWAAWCWARRKENARVAMVAAWGYATGGMLVPFAAHLEAWIRGATFRPDHPHEDINSIVLKGVIWAVCLLCLVISLRNHSSREPTYRLS